MTGVTIFYASDIHGSERVFRKFLKAAPFYGADVLIFGGDITGKRLIPIVSTGPGRWRAELLGQQWDVETGAALDDLETRIRGNGFYPFRTTVDEVARMSSDEDYVRQVFGRLMAETVERWVGMADEQLRAAGIPALMMPGNDDEPAVKSILAQGSWVVDAEGRVVDLEGYQVASFGYSTTTPWHSAREVTEADMGAALDKLLAAVDPERPLVLNVHDPPHASGLDLALKLTPDLRVVTAGGEPQREAVGSRSVREAIERARPVLSLHGHIHESRAAARVGDTLALNPGSSYGEGVLQGVLVRIEGNKVKGHQFVSG
jgi:uncharacterized protein